MEIKGTLLIPNAMPLPSCTIYLQVLDTSHADSPSLLIREERIDYDPKTSGHAVPFSMVVPDGLDPRAYYSLGVLVDVDGDGQVSVGDLIQDQSYPVRLNESSGRELLISLMEVLS